MIKPCRRQENRRAVADVEAISFEDAHNIRQMDVVCAARAGELHVQLAAREGHFLELLQDFEVVVGFCDDEEGVVDEDAVAFGNVASGEDSLAFSGGVFDDEGAGGGWRRREFCWCFTVGG